MFDSSASERACSRSAASPSGGVLGLRVEQAPEARDRFGDLEPAKGGPQHGLIAVHHGLVEATLDVLDGDDHARGRAAQEVAVGLGPAVLDREIRPLPRGDPEIFVATARESEAEVVDDLVAGLTQELDLVLVGGLHVRADEHELPEPELRESFLDGEAGRQGGTAAGLLDELQDARFAVPALGHRVGRAVEDDHARARVGERLRGFRDVVGELAQGPGPWPGHAQTCRVHADARGSIALELYLRGGVARGDDEADALGHRSAPCATGSSRIQPDRAVLRAFGSGRSPSPKNSTALRPRIRSFWARLRSRASQMSLTESGKLQSQ